MSLTAYWISAEDMHVTSEILQEAVSRKFRPEIPKPNVVSIPADKIGEVAVLDLIAEFQSQSDITLTHVREDKLVESFEFKGDPGPRFPTAF